LRAASPARLALVFAGLLAAQPSASQEAFTIQPLPKTDTDLSDRFTAPQIALLEKLNRRDREHLIRAQPPVPGLVVPEVWGGDELVYSPLPRE
jgi:hypothetical protein